MKQVITVDLKKVDDESLNTLADAAMAEQERRATRAYALGDLQRAVRFAAGEGIDVAIETIKALRADEVAA